MLLLWETKLCLQQLEYDIRYYYRKQCLACCHTELNNRWSMVSVSHLFNFEDISMASVCSVENHAPPVVLRSERQLEHGLCSLYGKPCAACCHES